MIGEDRLLPRLYRELAQDEKHFNKIAADAQGAGDVEEMGMMFTQMTQASLDLASKMTVASTLQSFEHDTIKFVVSHIS